MIPKSISKRTEALRAIPSVSALISAAPLQEAIATYGQGEVTAVARDVTKQLRTEMQADTYDGLIPNVVDVVKTCLYILASRERSPLRPVINATGVLLHTGLGRAPLADEAIKAIAEVSGGYCSVELDLETGERAQRSRAVEGLLCELTGAEAAHVVNNNAGATGLTVAALAAGREVLVSHGELIEIGGGFRLPEVISSFGATLRPVGTTNKTRVSDYETACCEDTGAILVVHPSNYQVTGFIERPDIGELATCAQQLKVPLIHDIGSGALIDFGEFGCRGEPVASTSIRAGADLVLFSGDKLLGGPQCGVIAGRRELVDHIIAHPLSRALRVDKTTLAALHATLKLYRNSEQARQKIPLLLLINTPIGELRQRAENLASRWQELLPTYEIYATCDHAFVGGGSLPHQALSSWSIAFESKGEQSVEILAGKLRTGDLAIVGRLNSDRLLLCLQTVFPAEDEALFRAVCVAGDKR